MATGGDIGWRSDAALAAEFERNKTNPCVGLELLAENAHSRVWSLRLAPGQRIGFHRHVLDYFWTSVTPGRAISRLEDGRTVERVYQAGDLQYERYGAGEYKIHDLENIGDADLVFVTVEFLDSANKKIELPAGVVPRN